ncbi:MAG: beta-galactosidase small subunit, partial [Lentisphaeria bacterium]
RGPHENYADRKAGCRIGRFESTVTEQLGPYVVPQECGNKEEVRWFTITDQSGKNGLCIEGQELFGFSALHFTPEQMTQAYHPWEMTPNRECTLLIDAAQRGVGTASCGPDTLEKYRVKPGTYKLKLRITPV